MATCGNSRDKAWRQQACEANEWCAQLYTFRAFLLSKTSLWPVGYSLFLSRSTYNVRKSYIGGLQCLRPFWQAKAAERPQSGKMVKFLKVHIPRLCLTRCCLEVCCSCFRRRPILALNFAFCVLHVGKTCNVRSCKTGNNADVCAFCSLRRW